MQPLPPENGCKATNVYLLWEPLARVALQTFAGHRSLESLEGWPTLVQRGAQIVAKQLEPPCKERETHFACWQQTTTRTRISPHCRSKLVDCVFLPLKTVHSFVWPPFEFTRDHFRPETQPATKPIAVEVLTSWRRWHWRCRHIYLLSRNCNLIELHSSMAISN